MLPDEKHSDGCYFTPPQRKTRTWPLSAVQLDAPTCSSLSRTDSTHMLSHSEAGVESTGRGGGGGGGGEHCALKGRRNKSEIREDAGLWREKQGENG